MNVSDAGPSPHPSPFETAAHLQERLVEAAVAQMSFNHAGLNAHLRMRLAGTDARRGALMSGPAIEAAAGYTAVAETLADLSGTLLEPELIAALTGGIETDYRMPADLHPYTHQLESWKHLAAPERRSVLVTSGTGSGKTECFLIPLLNDLLRESREIGSARLSGVRAIMLYPLNALIASQEERLRQWSAPFGGRIRFGLYNGLLKQELRNHQVEELRRRKPEQVFERKTLRADPPPILVTNVTMLEYMTIRKEDRPLVDNSSGMLRWIIIDEAHSYVGSAAAEIALLLRRVLQTFNVRASDVRFVATSATIGGKGEQARRDLRRFLAGLSGVDEEQVYVVEGRPAAIDLVAAREAAKQAASAGNGALLGNPEVQALIRSAAEGPISLTAADEILRPAKLDAVSVVKALAADHDGKPILPFRTHHFVRAVSGLWSCLNPDCSGDKPQEWPFGALGFEEAGLCEYCHAPLFEVLGCRACGEPYLNAFDLDGWLRPAVTAPDPDEFAATADCETGDDEEDERADNDDEAVAPHGNRRLIGARALPTMAALTVDPLTGHLLERKGTGTPMPLTRPDWDGSCPHCLAKSRDDQASPLRPMRFGAPFLMGNATPVLLDGVKPIQSPGRSLPAEGRRLLSFTDSRQGTARFAASIETNSERGFVRGYLYHLVQKRPQPEPGMQERIQQLRSDIAGLEDVQGVDKNATLQSMLTRLRAELTQCESPAARGVGWSDAQIALSQDPNVSEWIREVWSGHSERFKSLDTLANLLLLRELDRRPRRANSLETMGLVRLRFDQIERVGESSIPQALRERGKSLAEWRDFLYLLVDIPIRNDYALRLATDDVRWLRPRGGGRRVLTPPGEERRGKFDRPWPKAQAKGAKSNPVRILERVLDLDSGEAEHRAMINDILEAAWRCLRPLFDNGSEYSLDLAAATLCPVESGWLCPVTRRVLTHLAFGRSPYGLREHSPLADLTPLPLAFPDLPVVFPRSVDDRSQIMGWLQEDMQVRELRRNGVWSNLHDRIALLSPYVRAEEHSAQQPPDRLRGFEREFREGAINLLACSTTMEMGVDIGSVSAVMMTNVPPSIANYRQRIGRAGRRGQGFAIGLTLAKDTPLERETFREPARYLRRELRAPQVKLDSDRIVQRHVNALLLARWFSEESGEILKVNAGDFFGFPADTETKQDEAAPVLVFCAWLESPGTRMKLKASVDALTGGTGLAESHITNCDVAAGGFRQARTAFEQEWLSLREEAHSTSGSARKGVELQMRRLCQENLLKELANRSLLPSHGFPLAVVPFINDCLETRLMVGNDDEGMTRRRYDFPSRNADVAIREYAPGAEVVVDGLVWRSAGVTLNWKRPANQEDAREIQSLKFFWECNACGAADSSHSRPERCPVCASALVSTPSHFLQPAGFRVDWYEKPHVDTDNIAFVEPETPSISARNAEWQPLLTPALGRGRTSHEGIVFYSSKGTRRQGYRVCLQCGRAAEARPNGENPLAEHAPLRGGKKGEGVCPGGTSPFAVTAPIALGHEVQTDVAEFQPAALDSLAAAWAVGSALREALARQLGIQTGELGLGVEKRRGSLGQTTHSIFLFDKTDGGAGFATSLFDDLVQTLTETRGILDCSNPGCEKGCASCVLTPDLFERQALVDRREGLAAVDQLLAGMRAPEAQDKFFGDAMLSPPVADALSKRMRMHDSVTLFAPEAFDLTSLNGEPFTSLFAQARLRRIWMRLAIPEEVWTALDSAQRLGLRDLAIRENLRLFTATLTSGVSVAALIALLQSDDAMTAWMSGDGAAAEFGPGWGIGQERPIVSGTLDELPQCREIALDALLPKAKAAVLTVEEDTEILVKRFGAHFSEMVRHVIEPLGHWPAEELERITYSDRYLRSPLTVLLALRAIAGLRDGISGDDALLPVTIRTAPLDGRRARQPFLLAHDWQSVEDRTRVAAALAEASGLALEWQEGAWPHARALLLHLRGGKVVRLLLDQGFGYWRTVRREQFNFSQSSTLQAKQLLAINPLICGHGSTHIAIKAD